MDPVHCGVQCNPSKGHSSIWVAMYIPVQDGLSAAIQVVKLLLCDRVVDIHGWDAELPCFGQLVQPVTNTGRNRWSVEKYFPTLYCCVLLRSCFVGVTSTHLEAQRKPLNRSSSFLEEKHHSSLHRCLYLFSSPTEELPVWQKAFHKNVK